jgi:alkanesulfonate monooxygenase SsuD/methylene tetrahydromethanopterin reductase-like flavin-dependent oxidoreductase (luciferase family)
VQKPHPPIHFGRRERAALRRVADVGDGWYPFSIEPDDLAAKLARLDGPAREARPEPEGRSASRRARTCVRPISTS